jgi:predicted transcriptional regulator
MEMVGAARVAAVDCDHVEAIWRLHSVRAGIDRPTYDAYFEGSSIAVAISLTDVRALRRDIPLAELRRKIRDFRPPQSFRYLAHSEAAAFV